MKKKACLVLWLVSWMIVLFFFSWRGAFALCRPLADLAPQGAYGVADSDGKILDGCDLDRELMPASVLKIATVLAALDILGADYRFRTEFYLDHERNLYIRGYGDPELVSEEVGRIAATLRQQGLPRLDRVFVDNSAFALEGQVPGREASDNPYDAPVGALSVNFNTVPLVKKGKRVLSGEPQTPTLPLMEDLGSRYPAGQHRINICPPGVNASLRVSRYAGELFAAMLTRVGVANNGYGGMHPVPAQARRILTHESRSNLEEISRSTLLYSSNFMANLLFLACGAHQFGYPATWTKARAAVNRQLQKRLGSASAAIVQVEGAGLSRDDRVSTRAMLTLLQAFRLYQGLLREEGNVSLKTGTMTGVYNLAGYLPGGEAFVILLNQPANNRAAVLARLKKQFSPHRR